MGELREKLQSDLRFEEIRLLSGIASAIFGNRRLQALKEFKHRAGNMVLIRCIVHDVDLMQRTCSNVVRLGGALADLKIQMCDGRAHPVQNDLATVDAPKLADLMGASLIIRNNRFPIATFILGAFAQSQRPTCEPEAALSPSTRW